MEEISPHIVDHTRKEEWKPKGLPGSIASAHEKWHEQRWGWRAGCGKQRACGVAKERGLPLHGQLEDENQSTGQGLTHWETRRRQRS